ncbi:MAG TPA: YggS family pyridoxal phosphate-dependent enzyme [Aggregatilineales bacterium]|nr:YggS family pyridoxal phosphate-dependent enzyme [Anaerolineales bacterium]HRE49756.1 YggS family pyridoxal phosphate-dependent enzyme [Aggregatilineales bacterium]
MAYEFIPERAATLRATMAETCLRAGRTPETVRLIAVSKTHPPEAVTAAAAAGITAFGENRVEEAAGKIATVEALTAARLEWHMVGHVQSRKAADVIAAGFHTVHSVDSVKLATRLGRFAAERPHPAAQRILLEVNLSGEVSKDGFPAQGWENDADTRRTLWDAVRQIAALAGVQIGGLMTIAPIVEEMEAARPVFAALRRLRDALAESFPALALSDLSMGMTDDYPVAIEEGATLIRIGRALFGERG